MHFNLQYKKGAQWIPLKELLNWDSRRSNWQFANRYYELKVAKYWGLTPGQWDTIENVEEKAEMIAVFNCESMQLEYESYLRERRPKK